MSTTVDPRAQTVRRLIRECLPPASGESSILFGPGGMLDSLGLVNLLADIEFRVSTEMGRDLVLASERAMSRARSPFRTVDALTEYILELLAEHE